MDAAEWATVITALSAALGTFITTVVGAINLLRKEFNKVTEQAETAVVKADLAVVKAESAVEKADEVATTHTEILEDVQNGVHRLVNSGETAKDQLPHGRR